MPLVLLRVELPAYSLSFSLHVYDSSTILQIKQEIYQTCPGQPRAEGQRLIWRGRNLADAEKLEDLWKSPTDPRVVHLAVHPSAWTSQPPEILQPTPTQASGQKSPRSLPPPVLNPNAFNWQHAEATRNHYPPNPTSTNASVHRPLPYFVVEHQNALLALTTGVPPPPDASGNTELHDAAVMALERAGWLWPTILDENYPPPSDVVGVKYERIIIDGQPYLSLQDPTGQPSPVQSHALSVLSYTFTLLTMNVATPSVSRTTTSHQLNNVPLNVNQLLQQLGLPPLRLAQNQNLNQHGMIPQLREMPIRPLVVPLLMLLFRTLLLLYFVAPARKPIFGILILAWMFYEIWQPIRNGFLRGLQRVAENPVLQNGDLGPPAEQNAARDGQPPPPVQPAVNIPGPGAVAAGRLDAQAGVLLDNLANLNIEAEENIVNEAPGTLMDEPGLAHKAASFFGLLLTTLHPAVWNRRRVALRRREGVIRTEANIRQPPNVESDDEPGSEANGSAQIREELRARYARRPQWIQRYMDRVVAEEWVDDSD